MERVSGLSTSDSGMFLSTIHCSHWNRCCVSSETKPKLVSGLAVVTEALYVSS
jgi:hypothetical protein